MFLFSVFSQLIFIIIPRSTAAVGCAGATFDFVRPRSGLKLKINPDYEDITN